VRVVWCWSLLRDSGLRVRRRGIPGMILARGKCQNRMERIVLRQRLTPEDSDRARSGLRGSAEPIAQGVQRLKGFGDIAESIGGEVTFDPILGSQAESTLNTPASCRSMGSAPMVSAAPSCRAVHPRRQPEAGHRAPPRP
jgi:hypothetical protein